MHRKNQRSNCAVLGNGQQNTMQRRSDSKRDVKELESEMKCAQNCDGGVNYYEDYKESERQRKDLERQVERLQERVEHHEATIANLELEIENPSPTSTGYCSKQNTSSRTAINIT